MNKVITICSTHFLFIDLLSLSPGFEYCVNQTLSSWCPVENLFHLNRRRRWYRTRILKKDISIEERKVRLITFHFKSSDFRLETTIRN